MEASHSFPCSAHPLSKSRNHRVLQHVANISQTYQVSDQVLKTPYYEPESINTIDFHTGLFAFVSCGSSVTGMAGNE